MFISTSSNEGFGLPPLEALSRNCIPIGEAGGNATFSQNLFNCLTYDTQNKNNLLKAIKNYMEMMNWQILRKILKYFDSHTEKISLINGKV